MAPSATAMRQWPRSDSRFSRYASSADSRHGASGMSVTLTCARGRWRVCVRGARVGERARGMRCVCCVCCVQVTLLLTSRDASDAYRAIKPDWRPISLTNPTPANGSGKGRGRTRGEWGEHGRSHHRLRIAEAPRKKRTVFCGERLRVRAREWHERLLHRRVEAEGLVNQPDVVVDRLRDEEQVGKRRMRGAVGGTIEKGWPQPDDTCSGCVRTLGRHETACSPECVHTPAAASSTPIMPTATDTDAHARTDARAPTLQGWQRAHVMYDIVPWPLPSACPPAHPPAHPHPPACPHAPWARTRPTAAGCARWRP